MKVNKMNPQILGSLRRAFDEPHQAAAPPAEYTTFDVPTANGIGDSGHEEVSINQGPFALVELILKDPVRLDRMIREPLQQRELLPRFVSISLISFVIFGISMTLVLSAAGVWPHLVAIESALAGNQSLGMRFEAAEATSFASPWLNGNAFQLIIAYAVGLIAATGICLPSLYFYGLLAGIRMTMMDVVIHALKSKAVAAITLIGIIPIYAAFGLATAIFPLPDLSRDAVLTFGLVLPFIAGLSGTYSLYRGLSTLTDTMAARATSLSRMFPPAAGPVVVRRLFGRVTDPDLHAVAANARIDAPKEEHHGI